MKYIITIVIAVMLIGLTGCSDDKSSNPTDSNNPASNLYGSGTLAFTADSIGNFSYSGSFISTTAATGTGVAAWTGKPSTTSDYEAIIYARKANSTTSTDYASLVISNQAAITTGTYTSPGGGLTFMFEKGEASNVFVLTIGTCQITTYSASGMKGTFSGTAIRSSDGATVPITNGTFDVTFGTVSM
jgi:hypothetical protein